MNKYFVKYIQIIKYNLVRMGLGQIGVKPSFG